MALTNYTFDTSHSHISFSIRHLVIAKVRGQFTKWDGKIAIDEQDLSKSTLEATIQTSSIETREEKRDEHLKSPDFLDAAKYPTITFKGKHIEAAKEKGHYHLTGDLTIHGVTKEVKLEVEDNGRGKDPWGNDRAAFSAKTQISRFDFGLQWNQTLETGGLLVGEKLDIEIEVEAIKQKA